MAIALQTAEDFRKRLNEVLSQLGYDIGNERFPEGYQEAPLAYDAIWAVALGEACAYLPFLLFQLYSVIFIYICTMLFQLEWNFRYYAGCCFPISTVWTLYVKI